MSSFALQEYMTGGVVRVIRDGVTANRLNPAETAFMLRFAGAAAVAAGKRFASELGGTHIPPFLIASITGACNLHCAGCYARANHACEDHAPADQMTAEAWDRLFTEANKLGISFILLAGGEPLLRTDVIEKAAAHKNILFPIFTNGTFLSQPRLLSLLRAHRNLLPVISLEGDEAQTDSRRGAGVYQKVEEAMRGLHAAGLPFGASVTVTKENLRLVMCDRFLGRLEALGCRAVIFVEYVPVSAETAALALGQAERDFTQRTIRRLRKTKKGMVYIAFPGDEKRSGGCVAAGRGFFHINANGGAEPCPFSPYSDTNLRTMPLKEALSSPLFLALQSGGLLADDHEGGCTLFTHREEVEALLAGEKK